jgi:hypothetical protein
VGRTDRDSAGITIVENHVPPERRLAKRWTAVVDLVIGEEDGADAYTFGHVTDVAVDGRGRFLVLDIMAQELKVYDPSGRFVGSWGGPGRGPGELSPGAAQVRVVEDSIYVTDYFRGAVQIYGPDGHHSRTVRVPGAHYLRVEPSESSSLLARAYTVALGTGGKFTFWDGLITLTSDGTPLDTVLRFAYQAPDYGGAAQLRSPIIYNIAIWDRFPDGRLVWSSLDQDRVFIHASGGPLERIVSYSGWSRRPTTKADRVALLDLYHQVSQSPAVDVPERLPAFTDLHAGQDVFWVQRMGAVGDDPSFVNVALNNAWLGGHEWDVFDADGRFRGTVSVPDGVRITRIIPGGALGLHKDSLGVHRVVRLGVSAELRASFR